MNKYLKMCLFGLITWVVPFLVSFLFFSPTEGLLIEEKFFKSIMIVVSGLTGVILLVKYFKNIKQKAIYEGIVIGCIWLTINVILDLSFFIATGQMIFTAWLTEIGLRYLIIPIISIGMGFVKEQK